MSRTTVSSTRSRHRLTGTVRHLDTSRHRRGAWLAIALSLSVCTAAAVLLAQATPGRASGLRLYVLDGGVLESDPARYELTPADVGITQLSIAAYLIVHPKGVLLWDTGAVTDGEWTPGAVPVVHRLTLDDKEERRVTITKTLRAQLASAGVAPVDVTHLALSHYHWDHSANANAFASATWLVRPEEREAMWSGTPGVARRATYAALRDSRTTLLRLDEHDVFGDGTVIIKRAAGHTVGHQVLFVKLARTGPVLLSGDLYHYQAERTLNRYPTFEFDQTATRAARAIVDAFLLRTGAGLWIQHDLAAHRQRRLAPEYYD